MPTCSACDAEVVFVPSDKSGASMICDAEPEKRLVLLDGGEPIYSIAQVRTALASGTATAKPASVFTDHHATCPEADQFRRRPA
jgi:hypothetical protein